MKKKISKKDVKGAKHIFNKFCANMEKADHKELSDYFNNEKLHKTSENISKIKARLTDIIPKYTGKS